MADSQRPPSGGGQPPGQDPAAGSKPAGAAAAKAASAAGASGRPAQQQQKQQQQPALSAASRAGPAAAPSGAAAAAAAAMHAATAGQLNALLLQGVPSLAKGMDPGAIPPELVEQFRLMEPQMKALKERLQSPDVKAVVERYREQLMTLDPKDPEFVTKSKALSSIDLSSLNLPMPQPSPALKEAAWKWFATQPQFASLAHAFRPAAAAAAGGPSAAGHATAPRTAGTGPPAGQLPAAAAGARVPPGAFYQPLVVTAAKPGIVISQKPGQAAAPARQAPAAAQAPKPPPPPRAKPAPQPPQQQQRPPQQQRQQQTSPVMPPQQQQKQSPQQVPSPTEPEPSALGDGVPREVEVVCNGLPGTFLVERQMMACYCPACKAKATTEGLRRNVVSPSEFERHAGMGASKKWRWTVHMADAKRVTLGDWLQEHNIEAPRGRSGRSPYAAKKRKELQQQEEEEASRALAAGGRATRQTRSKRKQAAEGGGDSEEEPEDWLEAGDRIGSEQPESSTSPTPRRGERSPLARGGSGVSPWANGAAARKAAGAGGGPGSPSGPPQKRHRQLRWIRRSTASPEPEGGAEKDAGQGGGAANGPGGSQAQQRQGPQLLPLQRAAEAAERAAAAGVAGSAVGPRPLGLAPVATKRPQPASNGKPGTSEGAKEGSEEPPGLRSPTTGQPWLQPDHAMHEGHEGTDMRLGDEYQASLPAYQGPPPALGPSAEAQEPLAALPGPTEAEALASAAGPEKEQAAALPRDATADVWLRAVADHVRATVTGRQQRQRKQSRWLQETFDPNAVLGGKALVERVFDEDDAKDRFMTGRQGHSRMEKMTAGLEAALSSGATPDMLRWSVERHTDGQLGLQVKMSLGGTVFSGMLLPTGPAPGLPTAASGRLAAPGSARGGDGGALAALLAAEGGGGGSRGLLPAASGASLGSFPAQADTPRATTLGPSMGGAAEGGRAGPSRLAAVGLPSTAGPLSHLEEGESQPDPGAERRAAAEARFQRMEVAGAPKGTKCALCRGTDTDDIPEDARGLGGRSDQGLGRMILVRTSAVAHAWVHDQCARWSPEVYDPEGNNRLEGIRDAVRRGRMLRCKYCGEKGATLGCFKRTCRASYHLACARKYHCLLQVEPYLVACPEHVDDLPAPYDAQRAASGQLASTAGGKGGGGGKGRASRASGRAGGGGRDSDSEEEDVEVPEEEDEVEEDGQPSEGEDDEDAEEEQQQQPAKRQRLAAAPEAAAAAGAAAGGLASVKSEPLPLPIPLIPGAPGAAPIPWTRERIVEAPQLHAEICSEQAAGTRIVVVNFEHEHFRFRAFHSPADVSAAVQADSDAILLLDGSLAPAAAGWPHTHAFPELSKVRQADAFTKLLQVEEEKLKGS